MHLGLVLNLLHFLPDLGALYALRPTFMKSTPVLTAILKLALTCRVLHQSCLRPFHFKIPAHVTGITSPSNMFTTNIFCGLEGLFILTLLFVCWNY